MALPTKVALDTNILLAINELKIDVFGNIRENLGKVEFIIPTQVEEELAKLEKKNARGRKSVLIARESIKKNNVKHVRVNAKNADLALAKLSTRAIIASNDRELKKTVIKKNGHIIFLRQKKFIEVC